MNPSLAELLQDLQKAQELPAEEIPSVLLRISALQNLLAARMTVPPRQAPEPEGDRLLNAEEAGRIAGVSPRWFYRHKNLPFIRKLSRKVLRISEAGLRRFLAQKRI